MVGSSRPSVVDVTRNNPIGIIYVNGNSTDNGSNRFFFDIGNAIVSMQTNTDGSWNLGSMEFFSSSLFLGSDMQLSAAAGFLETLSKSAPTGDQRAFIPHTEIDEFGSKGSHAPQINALHPVDFFGLAFGETTNTIIGQIINSSSAMIIDMGTWQVGSIAPVDEVNLNFYTGTSAIPGNLFFKFNYPANLFTANQPITIDFKDDFGFDEGGNFFMEFKSDTAFSLRTDGFGNVVTNFDVHDLKEIEILTDDLVLTNDLDLVFDNDLNPMQIGTPSYSITL